MEEDKTFEFLELCLPNYHSRDDVAELLYLDMFISGELTEEELLSKYPGLGYYEDVEDVTNSIYCSQKFSLLTEAINNLDFKSIKTLQ